MKVAIMGAGLSGLTCAVMLERHGMYPTIFEKRDRVGDRFICTESMLSVLSAPIADPIRYLSEEFQIYIKPASHIGELIIHSEHQKASIQEHVGYINIRGHHEQSFEHQLAEQVKSEITFQSSYSYEEFTHVVVATGDASYAVKLRNFREDLSVSLKGATIKGEFVLIRVSEIHYSLDVMVNGLNGPIGKTLLTRNHVNSLKLRSYLLRPFVNK